MNRKIELVDYIRSSCELAKQAVIISEIYRMSNGNPCTDCAYITNCEARKTLMDTAVHRNVNTIIPETNKQIAARLGITPRQVSKLRKKTGG